jgi:DNA-directed RNA polymerase beta subunit
MINRKTKALNHKVSSPILFSSDSSDTNKKSLLRNPQLGVDFIGLKENERSEISSLIKKEYKVETFHRSNQDTCLTHKPVVSSGDWVQSGDLLTDCASSVGGELALGQNIMIAYMPWEGYNFEDAILISERLVTDDLFTSVHIERYEIEGLSASSANSSTSSGETKRENTEITRNIPDVDEKEIASLDSFGIIKKGSWVEEGDILVGRIAPINKKQISPYQKLLYTILDKQIQSYRDCSLRAPKGIKAKVIDIKYFTKKSNALLSSLGLGPIGKEGLVESPVGRPVQITAPPGGTQTLDKNMLNLKRHFSSRNLPLRLRHTTGLNLFNNSSLSSTDLLHEYYSLNSRVRPTLATSGKTTGTGVREVASRLLFSLSSTPPLAPFGEKESTSSTTSPLRGLLGPKGEKSRVATRLVPGRRRMEKKYSESTLSFSSTSSKRRRSTLVRVRKNRMSILKRMNKTFAPSGPTGMGGLLNKLINPSSSAPTGLLPKTSYKFLRHSASTPYLFLKEQKRQKANQPGHDAKVAELDVKKGREKIKITSLKNKKERKASMGSAKGFDIIELDKNTNFIQHVETIHIYLAEKRKIQVGDKMAGRHGNKGIVSQILPIEDMPFLPDGTPIDMVLNPLGVPSRMNVGQIYECLLGLAGKYLGENYKVYSFDEIYGANASRSFVFNKLYEARRKTGFSWLFDPNIPGKMRLYDGRTGDCFIQPVTVGQAYMLRLVHMVDDKIHMRSTGPYSLVTQQPLRGRSKQGGQRLGEMEVWAIEGYGAAFTLLEMLTIKSDDLTGRMTLWSNLILNKDLSIGTPEAFKVLVCELQALCLDIGLFRKAKPTTSTNNDISFSSIGKTSPEVRPGLIEIPNLMSFP